MSAIPAAEAAPTRGAGPNPPPDARRTGRRFAALRSARGVPRALLLVGTVMTAVFVVLAVFAPLIAPYGFDQYTDGGHRFAKLAGPSAQHLFGTTVQSVDVLSRVVFGARTALEVVVLAVVFSVLIGVPLGLLSGYFGGLLDRFLVLVMDALFAFPYLLLAIVIAFLLSNVVIGGGVVTTALAITVIYVPQYFRVVRASTLSAREATYVEAARAMGAPARTVISRYLFVNVVHSVPVIATLNAADAILTLAGLGFLGYGIQPTEAAEWGYDLQRAIADAGAGIWWTALYPGLAITLLVIALTLVGEGLNEVVNPALRRSRSRPVRLPARPERKAADR
ncbi:ABC transporter permease [Rugosimonospora africana]|uniref:Putative oligopeptide ABC transporter, permease protein n=1 Tax=Rugosimonospora africana TaxID=556532 RepID=A0A8J3QUW4_9ACTN|nr:ABC transporter permease [Rugosimonospora africana]GIH16208.1 putative oligopeptide ABC transporter, permease protein [Rugosimonospora africana]